MQAYRTSYLLLLTLLTLSVAAQAEPFRIGIGFRAPVSTFCAGVMPEAFKRLGLTATVTELPAERSIQMANDGTIDAECTRIKGIERLYPNLVQLSEPMIDVQFVAFVKGRNWRLDSGWVGLKPYDVAAVYGWKILEVNIPRVAPKSFTRVNSAESMFMMLDKGRIEIATLSLLDGLQHLRRMRLDDIRPVLPPLASKTLYFNLNKRHANLREPLERVIREMKVDGTWARVEQRVFGPLLESVGL